MALFERFHLSQDELETRLKRPLSGDPTRGEIGLVAALNANKYDEVRSRLDRDATIGDDLREAIAEHIQKARARWEARRTWSVSMPLAIWDEYARESRITGRSITECLAVALRRDYDRRKGVVDPLDALDRNVRMFHTAATQLLEEARVIVERLGPVQEINMRLARLEQFIGRQVGR
jgi:hypothetical protein